MNSQSLKKPLRNYLVQRSRENIGRSNRGLPVNNNFQFFRKELYTVYPDFTDEQIDLAVMILERSKEIIKNDSNFEFTLNKEFYKRDRMFS